MTSVRTTTPPPRSLGQRRDRPGRRHLIGNFTQSILRADDLLLRDGRSVQAYPFTTLPPFVATRHSRPAVRVQRA